MLFTSADYPLFLAAVFFLYGLGRHAVPTVGGGWRSYLTGPWLAALARLAVMLVLGDVVYLLLVKDTARLWDPIGGPILQLVTARVSDAPAAAPAWWHYLAGSAVLAGAVGLGYRGGAVLASARGQAVLARSLMVGVVGLGGVVWVCHHIGALEMLSDDLAETGHLGYLLVLGVAIGAIARDATRMLGRVVVLFLVSCVFYHTWAAGMHGAYRYLLALLVFTIVLDYYLALAIDRARAPRRRKVLLIISLVSNLGILGVFKYYDFFVQDVLQLPVEPLHLILPAGISFHTFQSLSYTIDVYRGKLRPTTSVLQFATFVLFFPQLVAGPIVRAEELLPQLGRLPALDHPRAADGLFRILVGVWKKIAIGDFLAVALVDRVFANPEHYSALEVLIGCYGYAFVIYLDFSAYSDIAIGSAQLLGFELPENFRTPYRSSNLQDFWRRWHISLSSWLRDYLYVPLGGSRGGAAATYRNLIITMLLGGLWHGASWTFIVWGLLHGGGLAVTRYFQRMAEDEPAAWRRVMATCAVIAVLGGAIHSLASGAVESPWIDLALAWMYLTPLWAAVTAWLSRDPAPAVLPVARRGVLAARLAMFAAVAGAFAALAWLPAIAVLPLIAVVLACAAIADALADGRDRSAALAWLGWALRRTAAAVLTFHYVCAAWVFFRAQSFEGALAVFRQLGTLELDHPNLVPSILVALVAALAAHVFPDGTFAWLRRRFVALPPAAQGLIVAAAALLLRELARPDVVPFIYFQF
jgi:D-alanyl-lipoteichoic acid acyltransferase DltB (MBOAT superfamily)